MTGNTARTDNTAKNNRRLSPALKRIILAAAIVALLVAMGFNIKAVPKGSHAGNGKESFSAKAYGKKHFPIQRDYITSHAVDASKLAKAVDKDQAAAGKKYGKKSSDGATVEIPVKFTGKVGKVSSSSYTPVKVSGLPSGHKVGVQLGPAISGTDLRDATGKIELGQFENQIQYQDAGSAINDQLKKELKKAGAPDLDGKKVTVTGVFKLVNPKRWNVTPAAISVRK